MDDLAKEIDEEIIKLQEKYSLETNVNNLKIKFNNFHGYFIVAMKVIKFNF